MRASISTFSCDIALVSFASLSEKQTQPVQSKATITMDTEEQHTNEGLNRTYDQMRQEYDDLISNRKTQRRPNQNSMNNSHASSHSKNAFPLPMIQSQHNVWRLRD